MKKLPETSLLSSVRRIRASQAAIIALGMAVAGIVLLVVIFAASGPFVALEAENGSLAGPAQAVTVSGASAGRAVKFGAVTTPTPTPPPTPTPGTGGKFGMSAPDNLWAQRLAEVGGPAHIKYRRIYITGFDGGLGKVQDSLNAGMTPIISWKTGSYSWSQVASGQADASIRSLVTKLNAIPGKKFLAIHHEPNGDGTPKDWSAMQVRALPILKTANQATVGVIGNGWWWSQRSQGLSDAQIAEWIPDAVINVSDVIAGDTYQDASLNEDGGVKMKGMADWARRHPNVKGLGVGEFNGLSAGGITNAMNVAKAESKFVWALMWNSQAGGVLGTPLSGVRLDAFKAGLATNGPTSIGL